MKAQQPTLLNLLGMAQFSPETTTGKPNQSADSAAFDLIFQSFMASPIAAPSANPMNPELATVDQLVNELPGQPESQPVNEPVGGMSPNGETDNLLGLTNAMSLGISPMDALAQQAKTSHMLETIATTLPQGTFTVKATTIENGIVTFDLASGNAGQSIRISIPLDSIDTHLENNLNRGLQSKGSFATIRDGIDIEQLLSRANVTSIDISTAPRANTTQNVIAINANQQGKIISLFATPRPTEIVSQALPVAEALPEAIQAIPQSNVLLTASKDAKNLMKSTVVPTLALTGKSSQVTDSATTDEPTGSTAGLEEGVTLAIRPDDAGSKANATNLKSTIENQWSQLNQTDSTTSDEVQAQVHSLTKNATPVESIDSPVSSNLIGQPSHGTGSASMQAAHLPGSALTKNPTNSDFGTQFTPEVTASFTLPKDLEAMTLHPGGANSVTLQLNPEHLGTARVHLTVQDDMVSARVVVDSHHAKAVVERSLNELLTQFERANIRVEQIQVTVSGEWQNSEHNRRQFWQAPRPALRFAKPTDDESESITDTVAKLFTPKQTPAFAGLNILA